MKIIKYIIFSILILISSFIFLFFIKNSFTWALNIDAIYSIEVPEKNFRYEMYFSEGGGATVAEAYAIRKTYNFLSYSYIIEVLDSRYVNFNEMKLSNDNILLTFKTGKSLDKLDSLYVKIE